MSASEIARLGRLREQGASAVLIVRDTLLRGLNETWSHKQESVRPAAGRSDALRGGYKARQGTSINIA